MRISSNSSQDRAAAWRASALPPREDRPLAIAKRSLDLAEIRSEPSLPGRPEADSICTRRACSPASWDSENSSARRKRAETVIQSCGLRARSSHIQAAVDA